MRVFTGIAVALIAVVPAFSQDDRRDREEPELVVEPGGRTGTCDALMFSDDGQLLFAVGDDKVVRVWPNGKDGLDGSKMQTLRWPSWREQRGGIKALALTPDGKRVVVGGFGLRSSSVAIINRISGEIEQITYPESTQAGENFYAVMSAAFSPDGKAVAFGTADGSVWFWRNGQKPERVGKHIAPEKLDHEQPKFNYIRFVAFLKSGRILSVAQTGQIQLWAPGSFRATSENLGTMASAPGGQSPVFRASLSPDCAWLAVGGNEYLDISDLNKKAVRRELIVYNLQTYEKKTYPLPERHFVRAVAFDREAKRLAVAIGSVDKAYGFSMDADDTIVLFDDPTSTKKLTPIPGPRIRYRADALAFDNLGRLAVACAENHQVYLWDTKNLAKPVSNVHGSGRNLWEARISQAGTSIAFRAERDGSSTDPNHRGMGTQHAFDLTRCKPLKGNAQWVEPLVTADGWTVEPDPKNRFDWWAVNAKTGARLLLPLDPDRDDAPRCYTFLNATADHPTRLLVGHFYGCSLYDLNEKVATRRQVFVGHAGEVMSVAPSIDQTWFVTCGADQTVAGWRLEDWKYHPQLGASIEVENNKLLVKKIDVGGPAWEMGLIEGDEIVLMAVADKSPAFNRSGKFGGRYGPATGSAQECSQCLSKLEPGQYLHLGWKRGGKNNLQEGDTSVRIRPLWRFFPAFNDAGVLTDWVVWMWKTSCYMTSTNGDFLVGWHVNHPSLDGTPKFYPAERFRDLFNKPNVVQLVLTDQNLGEAIKRARKGVNFSALEPAPVTIEPREPKIGPNGVELTLKVHQRGANPDLLPERVDLWVNDFRLEQWTPGEKNFEKKYVIPTNKLRDGDNQITLQTFNRLGGRGEAVAMAPYRRENLNPGLVGLFVGVNDYKKSKVLNPNGARAFGDLTSAVNDALRLHNSWVAQTGKDRLFNGEATPVLGVVPPFLDAAAKRQQIIDQFDIAAKKARPDDLFVLFLAGHGDYVPFAGKKSEPKPGVFVFCCPDYDRNDYANTGIPSDVLIEKLSKISCRKLVLLDACHSGEAASTNLVREMVPTGKGVTIISACDQQELAYENAKYKDGLFTYAVLEALGDNFDKADVNHDGRLDADELFQYVKGRLPALLKEIGKDPYDQNPICFPREPEKFAIGKAAPKKN
jgi:WD40 repeat protein